MNKLVTEERLTEIEKMFWYKRADGSDAAAKELTEAYRTLRTENERYRVALLKIEMGHSNEEAGRIAIAALRPEPEL